MPDTLPPLRSRYYDALLTNLDRVVLPELESHRARFLYAAARRMLANFAVAHERSAHLPEHHAALLADPTEPAMAAAPAAATGDPLRDALLAEAARLDVIEDKIRQRLFPPTDAAAQAGAAPALTAEHVQAALRKHLGPACSVRQFRILAGGRSKQTIMLTLDDGAGAQVERVVRRDLIVDVTASTVLDEFAVLVRLADHGLPVPRPLLLERDAAVLGSAFMLMEKVEGAVAGDVFDPPPAAQVLASARELARLHAVAVADIAPAVREDRRDAPDAARLRDEINALQKGWQEQSRAPSASVDAAFAWMRDNVAALEMHESLVHGDYSYHNILYDGERLSAVMDWELVRIGHPAEDLGYVRAAVTQRMPWSEFMAAYCKAGGPALPQRTLLFYALLSKLRLIALVQRARGFFEAGHTDDLTIADVCVHHMARMIHQLSVDTRAAYALAN